MAGSFQLVLLLMGGQRKGVKSAAKTLLLQLAVMGGEPFKHRKGELLVFGSILGALLHVLGLGSVYLGFLVTLVA